MRRLAVLFVFLAGCNNSPLAEFLDTVAPAKIRPEYRDGVEPLAPIPAPAGGVPLPPPAAPPNLPPPPPAGGGTPFAPAPLTIPNT